MGIIGEAIAARVLKNSNYLTLSRNFRLNKAEFDLIALKNFTIVFVEVKTRLEPAHLSGYPIIDPLAKLTDQKLTTLERAAKKFLRMNSKALKRLRVRSYRFDAIAITIPKRISLRAQITIRHLANFTNQGTWAVSWDLSLRRPPRQDTGTT